MREKREQTAASERHVSEVVAIQEQCDRIRTEHSKEVQHPCMVVGSVNARRTPRNDVLTIAIQKEGKRCQRMALPLDEHGLDRQTKKECLEDDAVTSVNASTSRVI